MVILFLVFAIALLIAQVFFLIQVTEVGIHTLNPGGLGFWVTENPFAWILVFLLLGVIAAVIRFVFTVVNLLATTVLAAVSSLFSRKDSRVWESNQWERFSIAYLVVWLTWVVASLYLTAGAMDYFAANPHLNAWLAEGDWLASILTYLGVFGLVCPKFSKD